MDRATVTRIENVYEHVVDIDLFTGGMAEKPVVGGIVGPTFACIIGQQFLNLRRGDRFWYEGGNHPGAFTPAQLQEIRKTSLARVVCDCMDDVELLSPSPSCSQTSWQTCGPRAMGGVVRASPR